jgi:hypothetical protein
MKMNLLNALLIGGLALALPAGAMAADDIKTVTGVGACAKCILKESGAKDHQVTITLTEAGKPVTYYLTENEATRKLGHPVCMERKTLTATGTVKAGADGKMELTPTKVEVVKE